MEVLRDWLRDPEGGKNFLRGSEARLWRDEPGSSFVRVPATQGEEDLFTKFVAWLLVRVLHRLHCFSRYSGKVLDPETGLTSYDESKLNTAGMIIATVLSSILPVVSIFVLYIVHNTFARIGITIGFTGCFAAILAIFSSARRVEIFAATAT